MVKQMPAGVMAESIMTGTQTFKRTIQTSVVCNFLVNLILSGSLQYLWGMINSLQIVFHFPGNSIEMPANAMMVYSSLISTT